MAELKLPTMDIWDQVGAQPYDPFAEVDAPNLRMLQLREAEAEPADPRAYSRAPAAPMGVNPQRDAAAIDLYNSGQRQLEAAAMPDQRAGRDLGIPGVLQRPIHATAEQFAPLINIPFNVQAEGQTNRALQIEFEERKRMALGTHEDFATLMRAAEETGNAEPMRWFVDVVRQNPNTSYEELAGELQATLLGNVEGAPAGHYGQPFSVSPKAIDALTRAHIAREWAIKPQMDAPQGVFENVGQIGGELVGQVAQLAGIGRLLRGSPLAKQAPGAVQPATFGTHGAVTAAAQGQDPVEGFAHGAMLGGALGLGARAAQASGLPAMVGEATAGYAATQDPAMGVLPLIPGIRQATGGAIEGIRRGRGIAEAERMVAKGPRPQYEQVNGQEVSNVPPSPPIPPEGQLPRPPAPPRGGSPTDQPKPMGDVQLVPAAGQAPQPVQAPPPPTPAVGPRAAPVQPATPQAAPGAAGADFPIRFGPKGKPARMTKKLTEEGVDYELYEMEDGSGGIRVRDESGENVTLKTFPRYEDAYNQFDIEGPATEADKPGGSTVGPYQGQLQPPPAEAPPPATAPAITPEPAAGTTPPGAVENPGDSISAPLAAPAFKRGDRVTWEDSKGQTLTGTIRGGFDPKFDDAYTVDVDQKVSVGGVPIGRVSMVPPDSLRPIGAPAESSTEVATSGNVPPEAQGGGSVTAPEKLPESSDSPDLKPGDVDLLNRIDALIASDTKIDTETLFREANAAYGGSVGEGKWLSQEGYEAVEAALNRYVANSLLPELVRTDPSVQNITHAMDTIAKVLDRSMPPRGKRSEEQQKLQQFSTPPHYAALAQWVAGVAEGQTVLEPSAGTGSLLPMIAKGAGKVVVNDLSKRRLALLKQSIPNITEAFDVDAAQIGPHLHAKGVVPDVIIMNPPFSQSATMGKWQGEDRRHIESALKILKPGGRLVAVIGGGMPRGTERHGKYPAALAKWISELAKGGKFFVRADIGITGDIYKKYGTSFPTRLLVIDKPKVQPAMIDSYESHGAKQQLLDDMLQQGKPAIVTVDVRDAGKPGTGYQTMEYLGKAGPFHGRFRELSSEATEHQINMARVEIGGRVQGNFDRLADAARALEGVRNERAAEGKQSQPEPGLQKPAEAGPVPDAADQPVRPPTGPRGPGAVQRPGTSGPGGNLRGPAAPKTGGSVAGPRPAGSGDVTPGPSAPAEAPPDRGGDGDTGVDGGADERPSPPVRPDLAEGEVERAEKPAATDVGETALVSTYRVDNIVPGAKKHPTNVVEPLSMAAIRSPAHKYLPKIPKHVIESGRVSDIQLETIAEAGHVHERMLPAAEGEQALRQAHMTGFGTGVGKGTIVAGMIMDNFNRGRTRSIWFVPNEQTMYKQALSDLEGAGFTAKQAKEMLIPHAKAQTRGKKGAQVRNRLQNLRKDNVILFVGYGKLKDQAAKGKNNAQAVSAIDPVDEIVEWFGKDYDGFIGLDESHLIANVKGSSTGRGTGKPSIRALKINDLQHKLWNSRIEYLSATAASDPANLAYMVRLGLWGYGTAFADRDRFLADVASGRMVMMEQVAREMKQLGVYKVADLAMFGDKPDEPGQRVEFERVKYTLTPEQRVVHAKLVDAWRTAIRSARKSLVDTGAADNGQATGAFKSQLWSSLQRFWQQVYPAMQMTKWLELIRQDIAEGRSPIVQTLMTGASTMERAELRAAAEAEAGEEVDIDASPKDILITFIESRFPTGAYRPDPQNPDRTIPVTDANGQQLDDPDALAAKNKLLEELHDLAVPMSIFDILFDESQGGLGPQVFGEISGRKRRMIKGRVTDRKAGASNKTDIAGFMEGTLLGIAISPSAKQGINLHSSREVKNQRRRTHNIPQLPWSAKDFKQFEGRSHRSNQVNYPIYRVMDMPEVPSWSRFISPIANRLTQQNAITRGEREMGDSIFDEMDDVENEYATRALHLMIQIDLFRGDKAAWAEFLDDLMWDESDFTDPRDGSFSPQKMATEAPVKAFLRRLLNTHLDKQARWYDAFKDRYRHELETARAAGTLDTGTQTLRGKITFEHEGVIHEGANGIETKYLRVESEVPIKRYDYAEVARKKGVFATNARSGVIWFLEESGTSATDQATGGTELTYRTWSPGGWTARIPRSKLQSDYLTVTDKSQAKKMWTQRHDATKNSATSKYHLVAGSMLPVWEKLPRTSRDNRVRIWRVRKPDGEMVLGREIPDHEIHQVLINFGYSETKEAPKGFSAAEGINAVLYDGSSLQLDNGWRIARKRVNNEARIEILGVPAGPERSILVSDGAFTEVIQHQTRTFIPTGDNSVRVMEKILQRRRIVDIISREQREAADAGAPSSGGRVARAWRKRMQRSPLAPGERRVVRLLDIRDALSRGLGIPIRARHQRWGNRAGFYRGKDPSIWTKTALDVATITHEVGHHIEKLMYGALGNAGRYAPREIRKELLKAGRALYGRRRPPHGYMSEGFGEFIRTRLLLGKKASDKHFPKLSVAFDSFVEDYPKIAKTLEKVEQMVNDYVDQGLVAQFAGQIVSGVKRRGNYWTRMMNAFFDPYYAIAKAEKEGEKATGIPLRPSESPYTLLSHVTLKADAKAYNILTEGLRDNNGEPMGPSLKEIIKPIITPPRGTRRILKRSWEQYTLGRDLLLEYDVYDKARRGERAEELGIDFGFPEGADRVVDYLENLYPFFKDVHKARVKFTDALLEYAHQAGAISRDDIKAVKKTWLDTYTPLIAFDPQDVKAPTGAGQGKHRSAKAIAHRKEGGEARINFLEAYIRIIRRVVRASDNARINRAIVAAYNRGGMGDHIREIKEAPRPVTFNLERIKSELGKSIDLTAATGPGGTLIDWDAFLSVWIQPHEYRGSENIISLIDPKTQKVRFFEVDPEWARALQAVDMEALPAFMSQTIGIATRAKKFGITGPFALSFRAANAFADAFMYPAYSEGSYVTAYGRLLKGYFKALFGEAGKRFDAQGGTVSGFQGIDQRHLKAAVDAAMASGLLRKALHLAKHPVELTRMAIVDVFEMGPRVAEYDWKMKDALRKGWSPEDANLMAVAAGRNVTIDFSKIGNQMRWITQIWAYSSASMGGAYTFAHKARTNPKNFWTHALVTVFGSLALWWSVKDEPWYRDLADWLKYGFWTFKTKTGTLIRLRIPWEFGWAFASMPVAMMDALYRKDPQIVKDAMGEAMNNLVPPFLPDSLDFEGAKGWIGDISGIGPVAEVGFNEETFTRRPIVPHAVEDLPTELQESRYTTELGKLLGKSEIAKKIGLGPAQIDHLLGEWTGGAITRGAEIIEARLKGEKLESRETPILRRFTVPPENATKWVGEYYDRLGELEKKKAAQSATKERDRTYRLSGRERDELDRLRELKPTLRELQDRQRRAKSIEARAAYQRQIDSLIKRTLRRAG